MTFMNDAQIYSLQLQMISILCLMVHLISQEFMFMKHGNTSTIGADPQAEVRHAAYYDTSPTQTVH